MVLGQLPVPGRPTILITVGQGPIAFAVGAEGGDWLVGFGFKVVIWGKYKNLNKITKI